MDDESRYQPTHSAMTRRDWYRAPRWRTTAEVDRPTWPLDTEYMISVALTLSKRRGDEDEKRVP